MRLVDAVSEFVNAVRQHGPRSVEAKRLLHKYREVKDFETCAKAVVYIKERGPKGK